MAKKVIDYLRGVDGDLVITGGDFKKGEATLKHQKTLLIAQKGDFKYSPTQGVGLRDFINEDSNADELQRVMQEEFEKDGMRVKKMVLRSFTDTETNAVYE